MMALRLIPYALIVTSSSRHVCREYLSLIKDFRQRLLSFARMPTLNATLRAPENKRLYPALDGLRAVAVLMVFTQHYFVYPEAWHWGWIGVRIFFVLSGFLITGILYDTRDSPNRLRVFYARRALRIFPLFYIVILAGWLLWPMYHWRLHPAWLLWPVYLGNYARFLWLPDFLRNPGMIDHLQASRHAPFLLRYGHFWSLCIEEQFYLVWPLIVFTVRKRERLVAICTTAVVLVPITRYVAAHHLSAAINGAGFAERFAPFQCDSLLLGALLALVLRKPQSDPLRFSSMAKCFAFAILVLFIASELLYFRLYHFAFIPSFGSSLFVSVGFTAVNLFGAALVVLSLDARNLFSRILQNSTLRWFGSISYGFYVFHDLPHDAYYGLSAHVTHRLSLWLPGVELNAHREVTAILAFIGTLILSALSYRYFEAPFLRLKRYFTIRIEEQKENPGEARAF
jgi:peptidoglycan/LPS O-acetylase OafA/YrhL